MQMRHIIKYALMLCSMEERKSFRFGATFWV